MYKAQRKGTIKPKCLGFAWQKLFKQMVGPWCRCCRCGKFSVVTSKGGWVKKNLQVQNRWVQKQKSENEQNENSWEKRENVRLRTQGREGEGSFEWNIGGLKPSGENKGDWKIQRSERSTLAYSQGNNTANTAARPCSHWVPKFKTRNNYPRGENSFFHHCNNYTRCHQTVSLLQRFSFLHQILLFESFSIICLGFWSS